MLGKRNEEGQEEHAGGPRGRDAGQLDAKGDEQNGKNGERRQSGE